MTEELYNKIDKFCNETDWKKYPTYEHALEDFINGIFTEKDKEIAELKQRLDFARGEVLRLNTEKDNLLKEKGKQIEELKKQSKRQSENYKHDCGVLLRNIAELEAQVEKMKVCSNCKYKYIQDNVDLGEGTRTDPCLSCRSHNMWEFAD